LNKSLIFIAALRLSAGSADRYGVRKIQRGGFHPAVRAEDAALP
jgi:hypothetical protein